MIMSDLDGTFFGKHATVVPRNLGAIERFKANGGLFTFASGRTQSNLFNVLPDAASIVNAPLSLSNGSCLYDAAKRRPVKEYLLDPVGALEAVRFIRERFGELGMRISTTEGFLVAPGDSVALENLRPVDPANIVIMPESEWNADDWYKIVVVGEPERLEDVRQACAARFGDALGYDKSGKRLFELHRRDRTKASMIDTYRELYASRGTELTVCAVGDYENDRDMLRAADIAVCPANATDEVKGICDLCLCENTEGVIADLIDYLDTLKDFRSGVSQL